MKKERLDELVLSCATENGYAKDDAIRSALLAVERETVERCAMLIGNRMTNRYGWDKHGDATAISSTLSGA